MKLSSCFIKSALYYNNVYIHIPVCVITFPFIVHLCKITVSNWITFGKMIITWYSFNVIISVNAIKCLSVMLPLGIHLRQSQVQLRYLAYSFDVWLSFISCEIEVESGFKNATSISMARRIIVSEHCFNQIGKNSIQIYV